MLRRILGICMILCSEFLTLFFNPSTPTKAAVAPMHYPGIHANGPQLVNAVDLPSDFHPLAAFRAARNFLDNGDVITNRLSSNEPLLALCEGSV